MSTHIDNACLDKIVRVTDTELRERHEREDHLYAPPDYPSLHDTSGHLGHAGYRRYQRSRQWQCSGAKLPKLQLNDLLLGDCRVQPVYLDRNGKGGWNLLLVDVCGG